MMLLTLDSDVVDPWLLFGSSAKSFPLPGGVMMDYDWWCVRAPWILFLDSSGILHLLLNVSSSQ